MSKILTFLGAALVFVVLGSGAARAQQRPADSPASGNSTSGTKTAPVSVTVPTPSFSNPSSAALNTQIPAAGTPLQRTPRVNPNLFGEDLEMEGNPSPPAAPPVTSSAAPEPAPQQPTPSQPKPSQPASPQPALPEPAPLAVGTQLPPAPAPLAVGTQLSPAPAPSADAPPAPVVVPKLPGRPVSQDAVTARAEMLEKIGDQLSLRMRALREREAAIEQREKAIRDREDNAAQREEVIRQIEDSLLRREEVVRRREQLPPPQSWRSDGGKPNVNARFAAVLDGDTMQFYHTKNALQSTPVASTQKLMTALVICSAGNLDANLTVAKAAAQAEPTTVGIKEGEIYTRRQLLTALLVKSGNDTAAALAIDNAGSIDAFAKKMNEMGRRIGLVNSLFKNPHGLPAEGQYSCARDIGVIAFEAYQIPEIREIVRLKTYQFKFNDGQTYLLSNTNRLLREWELCNGMKTGFTYAAGRCLVSSASVDGKNRISVVINSSNEHIWEDSRKLLDWSLGIQLLGPLTSTPAPVTVSGGI